MKIIKYKKLKDNRYIVYLDNDLEITLYDDIIIKYNLLITKEIDDALLKQITLDNDDQASYYLAVKYIAKRLRSEQEIREYLKKKEYTTDLIDKNVTKLKQYNLINDELFCKAYISDQLSLTLKGPYKIAQELKNLGVIESIYEELIPYDDEIIDMHAKKLIDNRIKANHKLSCNALKNKIKDDLFNMGYDPHKYIDDLNITFNDDNFLKRDYQKLANKYLNNPNKAYIIKQKLLLKGYTSDQINDIMT